MSSGAHDEFWTAVATATDEQNLREAIARHATHSADAVRERDNLLTRLQAIMVSAAVDQLRWLGTLIASAVGNGGAEARLAALRLQAAAFEDLSEGTKESAVKKLIGAAARSLHADSLESAVRVTHASVVFLFRFGETEEALRASEALIQEVGQRGFGDPAVRMRLYEFSGVTLRVPAGDRWIRVLTQIRNGVEGEADRALAGLISTQIAATLIRGGAYEEGLHILADVMPGVSRLGLLGPGGKTASPPEIRSAMLWRARAMDLRGQESEAEDAYRSHPALQDGSPEERTQVVGRLAELLIENNRLQEALDLLEREQPDSPQAEALYQALISTIYALLNRPEASAEAAKEAGQKFEEQPEHPFGATAFQRFSKKGLRRMEAHYAPDESYWRVQLWRIESAVIRRDYGAEERNMLTRAWEWAQRSGERAMEARCRRLEGEIELASGDASSAVKALEAALECELTAVFSEKWEKLSDDPWDTPDLPWSVRAEQARHSRLEAGVGVETLLSLGRAKAASGTEPTKDFDAAIAAARRRNRRLTLYYALVAKAQWLTGKDDKDSARALLNSAIDVLENLRADLANIESQIGILEDKEAAYGELLLGCAESGDGGRAMRLMERAKARALLEEIGSRELRRPLDGAREDTARALRQRLVRAAKDSSTTLEAERLKDEFSALYRTREDSGRRREALPAARAEDAARASAGRGVVLEFFVSERQAIAAVARDGRIESPVPLQCTKDDLVRLSETLRFEIGTLDYCHSLTELYDALIRPLESVLQGMERILVVPHGVLHGVPIHALRRRSGGYLVEQYSIIYAPSVAVYLKASRPGAAEATGSMLVAVNRTPYAPLPELRYAALEVEEAANRLPGAEVRIGPDAVRRHILRRTGDLDILHLACHGEFDRYDPLMSRVCLADGPLYGYEIERLQCNSRLAVLSACETGVQRRAAGDETFGLVRAFLARGAENVMASLWKVGDESTGVLMGAFYRELSADRSDVAGALKRAQLELLASGKYAHPFFWAPYVAIGGSGRKLE